jgi:ubiquinone/menaquinone biosynthesis C-methylase UbiE
LKKCKRYSGGYRVETMGDDNITKRIISYVFFDIVHPTPYLIKTYLEFFKDKLLSKKNKTPDLSFESLHWKRYYHQCTFTSPDNPMLPREEQTKDSILFTLNRLREEIRGDLHCLDVGCGPTSQFYTDQLKDDDQVQIISVDPLAETYKEIHKRYKTNYDIECITGYGEKLNELFPEEQFHLVYTQNAIDHSQNPIEFFNNCYNVIKSGGYLILHGFIREGSAAKWLGLHKWDIEVHDDDLLLTDKEKKYNRYNITKNYDFTVVYKKITGNNIGDMYTFIYKKSKKG